MLTVLDALKKTTEYLEKKGIESARVNAEIMLAYILKCKRLQLYLSFDRPLNENEKNLYREFLQRRVNHEPVQYITGIVGFYGLEFQVNKSVLIPRPETEILVETIIENTNENEETNILDIGTGSGNIAITLAKHLPNSKITAIDKSKDALKIAVKNSELNNVKERINFIENDILNNQNLFDNVFDLVVSNPPYISKKEYNNLEPELNKHEPSIALTDFSDGVIFYKNISKQAKNLLNTNGKLFFEIGAGQSKKIKEIMEQNNFYNIQIIKDYQNHDRVIWGALT
ncbi:MAG: peptide chain release factor N(5)-glutamine methyltransferase [Bacteroidetes bacterium]|nr:peptide chain release factor N(5)-glutamine methyltransferase [Bacteroidota bacterium]MCH8941718.1 peptide chain release factor N(5)-glutamine methyltransferase [Bacteroidota bacterium]